MGFVPGEPIEFIATVNNNSNKDIQMMSVKIIENMIFNGIQQSSSMNKNTNDIKIKQKDIEITALHFESRISHGAIKIWENSVTVPPVCQTSNSKSQIIKISYSIQLSFIVDSSSKNELCISIPFTVGTFPLKMNDKIDFRTNSTIMFLASIVTPKNLIEGNQRKGETIESNKKNYKPLYPFYKLNE